MQKLTFEGLFRLDSMRHVLPTLLFERVLDLITMPLYPGPIA